MMLYRLDTTVLVGQLRNHPVVTRLLQSLWDGGHELGTTCVNIAEVERGVRDDERDVTRELLDSLAFLSTSRDAASRAGRYQAQFARSGRIIHTADALIAGTAAAHGAVLVTDNVKDFPMTNLRVVRPEQVT